MSILSKILGVLALITPILSYAQTGPGGVGTNDGTSTLKIWIRTDFGVSVTGSSINSISNAAGISALDISETSGQRPTLVTSAVNGYDEISYSGSNRLRTGLNLTTSNFVTNQASSFTVCRADNTSQNSCVYTTDPLVGNTRFSNHIPWGSTVYYDIGTCCATSARLQVGGLSNLTSYSIWAYDASSTTGKQLYRNGSLLQSRGSVSTYNSHASHRFNIGGNTSGTAGFVGDVTEVIIFTTKLNTAQRIIIQNYLSAKFDISLSSNNVYNQDDVANGNYDHDVAGIGREDASNLHDDAQGSGIIRILNPSSLDNSEYLMWGHNNAALNSFGVNDLPSGIQARLARDWSASETGEVGTLTVRVDLSDVSGPITTSDLRLLVDDDGVYSPNASVFGPPTSLGSGVYEWTGIDINDDDHFTIGSINATQTPLPIEIAYFRASLNEENSVELNWQTNAEINNDYFTLERSKNGVDWQILANVKGAENSNNVLVYSHIDFTPLNGTSYYRLKQTDFDGHYSYSHVQKINMMESESHPFEVYPNPSKNRITIAGDLFDINEVTIYNTLGQDMSNLTEQIESSNTKLIIDISKLKSGVYYIKTNSTVSKVYKK